MKTESLRRSLAGLAAALICLTGAPRAAGQEGSYQDAAWFSLSPPVTDSALRVLVHTVEEDIGGWSFGLCHDPETASPTSFGASPELTALDGGGPEFLVVEEAADGERAGLVQAVLLSTAEALFLPRREFGFPVMDVAYRVVGESSVSVCDGLIGSGESVPAILTIRGGQAYAPERPAKSDLVPALFGFDPPVSDGPVTVSIHTQLASIQGWSLSLCHDPEAAGIVSLEMSEELATIRDGDAPWFYVLEEAVDPPRGGIVMGIALDAFTHLVLPASEVGFPIFHVEYEVFRESPLEFCDGLVGSGQPVQTLLTIQGQSYEPSEFASATLVQQAFRDKLAYHVRPPESGEVVTVELATEDVQVEGWSFALCSTALAADVVEIATAPELDRLVDGEPPEFVLNDVVPAPPFLAVRQTVLLGTPSDPLALGPFPDGLSLLGIRYRVHAEDRIKFCDQVGGIAFDNRVVIDGIGYVPATRLGAVLAPGALGDTFIRGDADVDGHVRVNDPIFVLNALFMGGRPLLCLDAADANDVGRVDISDAVYILNYLFLGDPPPPPPFPEAGQDLSPDTALGCERGL